MKKIFSLSLIAFLLLALAVEEASAQRFTKRKRYSSVGVSLNAMNYFGDIVPESDFTSLRFGATRPNIGINYTKRLYPRISVRGNFFWGRITGDDAKAAEANEADNRPRHIRNLSFRNDIKELSGTIIVDLFENRANYIRRPDFVPYGFVGVGVIHHNPKAYWDGGSPTTAGLPGSPALPNMPEGWYELQPLGTEGQNLADVAGRDYPEPYKRVQVVIPAGIGIRYKLDRNWDLAFEIGWRKTFTDYLDDVSTEYVDKAKLLAQGDNGYFAAVLADRSFQSQYAIDNNMIFADPNAPNSVPGHANGFGTGVGPNGKRPDQRGDSSDKDWYIVTGFNLSYILNPNVRSPKFR